MLDLQAFLHERMNDGVGVREIARDTGIAASTISRICNGKISPRIDTAQKTLERFGYKLAINKIELHPISEPSEQGGFSMLRRVVRFYFDSKKKRRATE